MSDPKGPDLPDPKPPMEEPPAHAPPEIDPPREPIDPVAPPVEIPDTGPQPTMRG